MGAAVFAAGNLIEIDWPDATTLDLPHIAEARTGKLYKS